MPDLFDIAQKVCSIFHECISMEIIFLIKDDWAFFISSSFEAAKALTKVIILIKINIIGVTIFKKLTKKLINSGKEHDDKKETPFAF